MCARSAVYVFHVDNQQRVRHHSMANIAMIQTKRGEVRVYAKYTQCSSKTQYQCNKYLMSY
jgi:hypothetical protein